MTAAVEGTQRHASAADVPAACADLRWLWREAEGRAQMWRSTRDGQRPAFEPIRLVADSALQYEPDAVGLLIAAAAALSSADLEPAYPSPGARLRAELVIAYDPPALASSAPEHRDAPDLWLSNLRCELRPAITAGWAQLDPPWPGVTAWQRWREAQRS